MASLNRLRLAMFAAIIALALWLDPLWIPLAPVALFMPPAVLQPSCAIFSDNFLVDRTGTDYDTISGSWAVTAGVGTFGTPALTTSSTGALIVAKADGSTGHGFALFSCTADTAGASAQLIGSYVDDDNYLFAEITFNHPDNTTVALWKREGGVNIQISTTFVYITSSTLGLWQSISLCWDGTNAYVRTGAVDWGVSVPYTGTGNRAGIGGSGNGGTVKIDDFSFTHHQSDNPTCNTCQVNSCACDVCLGGTTAQFIQIDLSGFSNGGCTTCDSFHNASFVVQMSCGDTGQCGAIVALDVFLTCYSNLGVLIERNGGGKVDISVNLGEWVGSWNPAFGFVWKQTDIDPDPDCGNFDAYEIPFDSSAADGFCDHDGSSVFLNSVPL